jgi:uncharacterized protein (TIGR02996 family)
MTPDEAFLADILVNPDDDSLRLIYADWLDDHGQSDRAAFIRVQIELAHLPYDDSRRHELEARERTLLAQHTGKWLQGILKRFLEAAPSDHPIDEELRGIAEGQHALPLMADMGGCYALRLDGEVVGFLWGEPDNPRLEEDPRVRNVALFQGGEKYPETRLLLPPRPLTSRDCPFCQGAGIPPQLPDGAGCYCGGLGWIPRDSQTTTSDDQQERKVG